MHWHARGNVVNRYQEYKCSRAAIFVKKEIAAKVAQIDSLNVLVRKAEERTSPISATTVNQAHNHVQQRQLVPISRLLWAFAEFRVQVDFTSEGFLEEELGQMKFDKTHPEEQSDLESLRSARTRNPLDTVRYTNWALSENIHEDRAPLDQKLLTFCRGRKGQGGLASFDSRSETCCESFDVTKHASRPYECAFLSLPCLRIRICSTASAGF